mgnify:FL=1
MANATINAIKLIDIKKISDPRGNLSVIENQKDIPFDIKRVYYLYDVPGGESRGAHANKALQQLIIAINGSFVVTLDDGNNKKVITLNRAYQGLYVPAGLWRDLTDFTSGSVCVVLASPPYTAEDYIRNYDEFIKWRLSNEK